MSSPSNVGAMLASPTWLTEGSKGGAPGSGLVATVGNIKIEDSDESSSDYDSEDDLSDSLDDESDHQVEHALKQLQIGTRPPGTIFKPHFMN